MKDFLLDLMAFIIMYIIGMYIVSVAGWNYIAFNVGFWGTWVITTYLEYRK